jgi:chloramphenicol 3-O-phosphotransferase
VPTPGQIVVLNGVPRSGKSSIVAAIQDTSVLSPVQCAEAIRRRLAAG